MEEVRQGLCAYIVLSALFLSSYAATASDYENIKSPIFVGVERVYIYLEYISATDSTKIPTVLKRDAIERELLAIYKERFSSTQCAKSLKGKHPYECNDQPITLVPESDSSDFILGRATSFATADELVDPGTLNVIARVHIMDGLPWFDPPLQSPLLSYYVIQDRPGSRIPITWWVSSERVLPINQSEDKIMDRLLTDLRGNIH